MPRELPLLLASLGPLLGICCVPFAAARGRFIPSFAGPYLAYPSRFSACEQLPEDADRIYFGFNHFNPHRPLDDVKFRGNWTKVEPFDDLRWSSIVYDIRSNNQWKQNAFVLNASSSRDRLGPRRGVGACSYMRTRHPTVFRFLFRKDPHVRLSCPVPAGLTVFAEEGMQFQDFNDSINVFPYGDYRLRYSSGKAGRLLTCFHLELRVVPYPA